jgi:hypothetical protein
MRRVAHVEEALAVARLPALAGMRPARLAP